MINVMINDLFIKLNEIPNLKCKLPNELWIMINEILIKPKLLEIEFNKNHVYTGVAYIYYKDNKIAGVRNFWQDTTEECYYIDKYYIDGITNDIPKDSLYLTSYRVYLLIDVYFERQVLLGIFWYFDKAENIKKLLNKKSLSIRSFVIDEYNF